MDEKNTSNNNTCIVFQDFVSVMDILRSKMIKSKHVPEKAQYAEEILVEANTAINCSHFNDKSVDCINCRIVAGLNKKTADLVINAKKLA